MLGTILLGCPGAGKGTIGHFLSEKKNIPHFSSGDLLREQVSQNSLTGRQISDTISRGEQVADQIITNLVLDKLRDLVQTNSSFILDGFPQTLDQNQALVQYAASLPSLKLQYVCVEVEPTTALERMVARISCSACGALFSIKELPEEQLGNCTKCTGTLITRNSDAKEFAEQRIATFARTTQLVMDDVCTRFTPIIIDGNKDRAAVIEQLTQHLLSEKK